MQKKMLKLLSYYRSVNSLRRNICVSIILKDVDDINKTEKKHKRKVSQTVELVKLVDQNDKILGLKPKPEAEKLAKKLNLILEKVTDPKFGTQYPPYKLFSASELMKAEKKATTARVLKKLPINSRISDHDLEIKLQIIRKWIAKNCEVHITILSKNEPISVLKTVYNKITENFKSDGRILDVREKEDTIKFIIIPPKKVEPKQENAEENTNITKSTDIS